MRLAVAYSFWYSNASDINLKCTNTRSVQELHGMWRVGRCERFYQLVVETARPCCWMLPSDWSKRRARNLQRSHINPCRFHIGPICHASLKGSEDSNVRKSNLIQISSVSGPLSRAYFFFIKNIIITYRAEGVCLDLVVYSGLRWRCLWGPDFFFWFCWTYLHMNWIRTSLFRPEEPAFLPIPLVSNAMPY